MLTRRGPAPGLLVLLACLAAPAAAFAQSAAARVTDTRSALQLAQSARRAHDSKDSRLAVEKARQAFAAASAARIDEIRDSLAALGSGHAASSAGDAMGPAPASGPAESARRTALMAELRALSGGPSAPNIIPSSEVEPNGTPGTATPLVFRGPVGVASGAIKPGGDVDVYSFDVSDVVTQRVWVLTDTGGTQNSGATSRDTVISLIGSDGSTVIESDDDDGTGNGGDGSVETGLASAIAGASVSAPGKYYIQVKAFSPTAIVDPYKVFVILTDGATLPEVENDDSPGSADDGVMIADAYTIHEGAIASPGDVDYYRVNARVGDTLYVNADADPERDGGTDLVLEVIDTDGATVLLTIDSSITSTGAAESGNYFFTGTGTYYVRVHDFSPTATGTYSLMLALLTEAGECVTTVSSALGSDGIGHPALHGVHDDRLTRDASPKHCDTDVSCPGLQGLPGLRKYDAYSFYNASDTATCINVSVDAQSCVGTNFLFVSAYLGGFDPDALCAGYLGDSGSSPNPTGGFSFEVPPHSSYVVVVDEVTPGAGCTGYKLQVAGTCPAGLAVDAHNAAGSSSNLNGVLESGETVLVEPSWRGVDGGPLAGMLQSLTGPAGPTYSLPDFNADYGTPAAGAVTDCYSATTNCYQIGVSGARPLPHWDISLSEAPSTGAPASWLVHVGGSFGDVPPLNLFYPFIENIFHNGVTGGGTCGGYCPDAPALRKQMAVFVLKAREGASYTPPPASGIFNDVPVANPFAPWIEELYNRGVVAGCSAPGGPNYCPDDPVLRQQMAVFLLKTLLGSSYVPPAAIGIFGDVSPASPFAPWIEDLFDRGIAAGCGGGNFCPTNQNLRKQMAPFLVKTFGLVLYGR